MSMPLDGAAAGSQGLLHRLARLEPGAWVCDRPWDKKSKTGTIKTTLPDGLSIRIEKEPA